MRRETIANIITSLRIPLAVVGAYFVEDKKILLSAIVLAWLSDCIDGFIAGKGSRFGTILDPLADKIFMVTIGIALLHTLEWEYLALFFSRDIFVVLALGIAHGLKRKGIKARFWGKTVTALQFVTLTAFAAKYQSLILIDIVGILSGCAMIEYVIWFRRAR